MPTSRRSPAAQPSPPAPADRDVTHGLRPDAEHGWRHTNTGRLLLSVFHRFEMRVIEHLSREGFEDIRITHFNVMRHVDFDGTRIVDLANRVGMTKGAMGELVQNCVGLGLVGVRPDPQDGRAKIVSFSARGQRFMEVAQQAIERAEAEFAGALGEKRYRNLRETLLLLEKSGP